MGVAILSGGRSHRFGRDKLRHSWKGRTLLDRVVSAGYGVADRVWLLARDPTQGAELKEGLTEPVDLLLDGDATGAGPGPAIFRAVMDLPVQRLLVLPGDLAFLTPEGLRRWVESSRHGHAWLTSLWDPGTGQVECACQFYPSPLFRERLRSWRAEASWMERASSLLRLCPRGELLDRASLSSDPREFLSIDREVQLETPPPPPLCSPPRAPKGLDGKASELYREALRARGLGQLSRARHLFLEEAEVHQKDGIATLALHARSDARRTR